MKITQALRRIHDEKWSVRFIISRILRHTGLCQFFFIQRNGYKLKFFPTALSTTLWYDPISGAADEEFLRSFLREGDTVVDVGANIGTLSIAASIMVGKTGQVFSIEAHPKIADYLRENLFLNSAINVTHLNYAVSDRRGFVLFSDQKSDDQNRILNRSGVGIEIQMVRLEDIINSCDVTLLKIDVEGHELMVLRGANSILERCGAIYFEANNSMYRNYGYCFRDIHELLYLKGFHLYRLDGQEWNKILGDIDIIRTENILALNSQFRSRLHLD
jgi:FkbM family methyltransferase